VEPAGLLRAFAWTRLGVAGVLLITVPLATPDTAWAGGPTILRLALLATAVSSAAVLATRRLRPERLAAFLSTMDIVLITAVVAVTGGPRSIYPFLYVLSVTASCVLLPRAGGLALAGLASLLYAGLVLGRTVFPIAYFIERAGETTALELVTIFLNTATFVTIAIVAGGIASRYRITRHELETRQRDLRDLEAFRDLVFDCVGTGLAVLDPEHRVTAVNRAATQITGRSDGSLTGMRWSDIVGGGLDLSAVQGALQDPAVTSVRRESVVVHRPDGHVVPVLMTFSALRSAAGETLGLIAACEDLSALRDMEARMRHADRLASLGRMAANVAHEIRNPLASMTGAIEALGTGSPLTSTQRDTLTDVVLRESTRLNRIVEDFLSYARPSPLARERVDVAALVDEVLMLLEHRPLPPGIKLVRDFEAPLWAHGDPNALRQVFWNLALNAVQAMPAGGELTITATREPDRLRLRVTDTGDGIASEHVDHIFEPFFSTKTEGSGLGLALVHRIIEDHGGALDVHSTPGAGTTFTVSLPDTDDA
jgi:two-component system sensor histidine kinase PilS (NtrC family)